MSLERIHALISPGLSTAERLSQVKNLIERHGVLLDRINNNTDRPKGKKPGGWPCQCYPDIEILMGRENLEQIFNSIARYESCHDRRSKLTMHTANNQFHALTPQIRGAFIAQFEQLGRDLSAYKVALERGEKKR